MDSGHRRVSPGRESIGSDLYTVISYDPKWQTCDLQASSTNQRGSLKQVPIVQYFGGSWESQAFHKPELPKTDTARFGNCTRGARWGISLPIQPGDKAIVNFLGESQADPVIVGFLRNTGDAGIPWAANQLIAGNNNPYTGALPEDAHWEGDRFDVLLPTGAWVRSTGSGSWTISTPPAHLAKSFISLDAAGKITLRARNEETYNIRLEFDPNKPEGKIVVDDSWIEFKEGNITLRAKDFKIFAQDMTIDLDKQDSTGSTALKTLESLGSSVSERMIQQLSTAAVGAALMQGSNPAQAVAAVLNNPKIDTHIRDRLTNSLPDLPGQILSEFTDALKVDDIAAKMTQFLGAESLAGNITDIVSRLDLTNLDLAKQLGIPTWVGSQIQKLAPFPIDIPDLANLSPDKILPELMRHTGVMALNGNLPPAIRSVVDGLISGQPPDIQGLIKSALPNIAEFIVPGQGNDYLKTAQELGKWILSGNNLLGDKAMLFDYSLFENLGLKSETLDDIRNIGSLIEKQVGAIR
ncbi:MAG: hypothetical protein LRZ84_14470 [Desertifilum sp.]|nr:hypothetical protein [Desertifilum sp.]